MAASLPTALGIDGHGLFIGGQWLVGEGPALRSENPGTGETLLELRTASTAQVDRALSAARAAQAAWGRRSNYERAQYLLRLADLLEEHGEELKTVLALEVGKPLAQGAGELEWSAATLRYQAEWARRLGGEIVPSDVPGEVIHLTRVPVGVVAAICAWNFPIANFFRKVAPALLVGNAVVLKSSETTPLAAIAVTHLLENSDLPPGVLNLVTGGRETGADVVGHPFTDMVTMTGSVASGKAVMATAAGHLAKVSLELGGKAPAIVWADADLEETVNAVVAARHTNSGQVCTSAERVYVHRDVLDEFVDRYVAAVGSLRVGNPFDDVDLGPLVSKGQQDKVARFVDSALIDGAQELFVGDLSGLPSGGFWSAPTVLLDPPASSVILREEVFGPVTPIISVGTVDEILASANDSPFGLSGYIFSNNYKLVHRLADELQCGELYVNRTLGEAIQGFHSGHKQSGIGGEDGLHGVLSYTEIRTVYHHFGSGNAAEAVDPSQGR